MGGRPGTPAAEACFSETSGRRPQEPRLASNPVAQQRRGCSILRQGRQGGVLFSQRSAPCSPLERGTDGRAFPPGWGSYDSLPQAAPAAVSPRTDAGWICLECHGATSRLPDTHTHTHKAEHPRPPPVSRVPGDVQDGPHRTGLYFMPCGLLQFADLGHKIGSAHALRGSLPQGMPPLPWMTPHWLVMMLCPSAPSQTQRGQTLSACHTMGLVHGVSQSTVLPFRDPPGSHA